MSAPMAVIDLRAWCRSPQGLQMINAHKLFCAGGEIWQGYQGTVFRVTEDQLEESELDSVPDLDNTMSQVLFKRAQRVESRYIRKDKEYDARRGELRAARNEIRNAMKADKELGLAPSPGDLADMRAIDNKTERILAAKEMNDAIVSKAKHESQIAAEAIEVAQELNEPDPVDPAHMALCGKCAPEGHVKPKKWVTGHQFGCKTCRELRG